MTYIIVTAYYFSDIWIKSKIMYPSLPYSELQEKFCEGFAFFPFKALEQYEGYIYKSYTKDGISPGLLEQCGAMGSYSGLHAQVLLLKLLQRDIPVAGVLLSRIEAATFKLENMVAQDAKRSLAYMQLLETIRTFQAILTIYKHQVQEQMATQLTAICNTGDYACIEEISRKDFGHIRSVVGEFLDSTEVMCSFLEGWLSIDDHEELRDILKTMTEFRDLQKKTIYVLEQWRQEDTRNKEQQAMN